MSEPDAGRMRRFARRLLFGPPPAPPRPPAPSPAEDVALRAHLSALHPPLADPTADAWAKLRWLRGYVYENAPDASFSTCLDMLEPGLPSWTAGRIVAALAPGEMGFKCAGAALLLHKLCTLFSFASCVYNAGDRSGGRASHAVTIVALPGEPPLWAVLDPYFDRALVDERGAPLDFRRAIDHLCALDAARVRSESPGRERRFLMRRDETSRIASLEAAGARRVAGRGDRVVLALPSTPALWTARHPELASWAARERLPADPLYFLLSPLGVNGPPAFDGLATWVEARRAELRRRQGPLRIVYAPGKTGTHTLEHAIARATPVGRTARTHLLARGELRRLEHAIARAPASRFAASQRKQLAYARALRDELARRARLRRRDASVPKPELVVAVREPMARLLASVFQQLDAYGNDGAPPTPESVVAQILRDPALEPDALSRLVAENRRALHEWWLEHELAAFAGIDVYATPFPHDRGWQLLESPRARVLVVRTEDLPRLGPPLAAFLGVERVDLTPANVGDAKPSGALYRACRERCRFPADLLERLYASRYATHFYTPEERARLRARWAEPGPGIRLDFARGVT